MKFDTKSSKVLKVNAKSSILVIPDCYIII